MAIFGPYVPSGLLEIHPELAFVAPSLQHLLGTDYAGRDILAQIVYGARSVLSVSFLAAIIIILLGTTIGMVSGLRGGKADNILMFATDLSLSIPSMPLLLLISSIVRNLDAVSFALVLSITSWAGLSRAVRSQVLSLKNREFIESSITLGLSTFHIVFQELLPNVAPYIAVSFLYSILGAMNASVGLFFLGLISFDLSHWGVMLNQAIGRSIFILIKSCVSLSASPYNGYSPTHAWNGLSLQWTRNSSKPAITRRIDLGLNNVCLLKKS
jgi:peptide/nickel transport system permease protein